MGNHNVTFQMGQTPASLKAQKKYREEVAAKEQAFAEATTAFKGANRKRIVATVFFALLGTAAGAAAGRYALESMRWAMIGGGSAFVAIAGSGALLHKKAQKHAPEKETVEKPEERYITVSFDAVEHIAFVYGGDINYDGGEYVEMRYDLGEKVRVRRPIVRDKSGATVSIKNGTYNRGGVAKRVKLDLGGERSVELRLPPKVFGQTITVEIEGNEHKIYLPKLASEGARPSDDLEVLSRSGNHVEQEPRRDASDDSELSSITLGEAKDLVAQWRSEAANQ